jgi:hypothetical protein
MSKVVVAVVSGLVVGFLVAFGLSALTSAAGDKPGLTPIIAGAFLGALTAYVMGNLAGNRKVQTADAASKQAALTFQPPAGQGTVIIYRQGFMGSAAGMNVFVDGKEATQLKSPRFTAVNLAPGPHTVGVGFGGLAGPQNRRDEQAIEVVAGETKAFKAAISMGLLTNALKLQPAAVDDSLRRTLSGMTMVAPEIST